MSDFNRMKLDDLEKLGTSTTSITQARDVVRHLAATLRRERTEHCQELRDIERDARESLRDAVAEERARGW